MFLCIVVLLQHVTRRDIKGSDKAFVELDCNYTSSLDPSSDVQSQEENIFKVYTKRWSRAHSVRSALLSSLPGPT